MTDSEDELKPDLAPVDEPAGVYRLSDLAPDEHESAAQLAEDAERSARRLGSGRLALGMAAVLAVTVFLRMLNLTFPISVDVLNSSSSPFFFFATFFFFVDNC